MTLKILLVDDEPEIRELLQGVLTEEGYTIDEAGSGNEAWNKFINTPYDIVITDVKMPDGDGIELLKKIKDQNEEIPVIMMTGYSGGMLQSKELLKSNAILRKPFDLNILLLQVKQYFEVV